MELNFLISDSWKKIYIATRLFYVKVSFIYIFKANSIAQWFLQKEVCDLADEKSLIFSDFLNELILKSANAYCHS